MTTLGGSPEGARLIESLTEAIKNLSLAYAGTPDEKASASVEAYIGRIEPEIVKAVGAGPAEKLLDAFAAVAMGRKHEIEAARLDDHFDRGRPDA